MIKAPLLVSTTIGLLTAISAQAAITALPEASVGFTTYDGNVAINLITSGQSTLGSRTVSQPGQFEATFPTVGVNDGSAAANANFSYWATKTNGNSANWMPVTITFELAGSSTGYDLTSIQSIAGWSGANLGSQQFQLLLSLNNSAYIDYGTYANTTTLGGGNNATMTTLSDTTGTIASGVTGIQFIFMDPDPGRTFQGGDGGTVIHELQAFGTPTAIPEPCTLALAGIGISVLSMGRRRHALKPAGH